MKGLERAGTWGERFAGSDECDEAKVEKKLA